MKTHFGLDCLVFERCFRGECRSHWNTDLVLHFLSNSIPPESLLLCMYACLFESNCSLRIEQQQFSLELFPFVLLNWNLISTKVQNSLCIIRSLHFALRTSTIEVRLPLCINFCSNTHSRPYSSICFVR